MSLDQRIVDSLASYADGVDMTSTDLDRMQHDLHRRLGQPAPSPATPRARRGGGPAAGRRRCGRGPVATPPDTSIPADPGSGAVPQPGVYLFDNGTARNVGAIHADGTERDFGAAGTLVNPLLPFRCPSGEWTAITWSSPAQTSRVSCAATRCGFIRSLMGECSSTRAPSPDLGVQRRDPAHRSRPLGSLQSRRPVAPSPSLRMNQCHPSRPPFSWKGSGWSKVPG
jgi:hypothetical protein